MHSSTPWSRRLDNLKETLLVNLSRPDARLQPALLGLVVGLMTGLLIVAFRLIIELTQDAILPGVGPENYEGLSWPVRLLIPIYSGFMIGLLFTFLSGGNYVVGILYVLERLNYFQGHMHWRPLLMQFFGACIAIIGGHSVGREGPGVHLGAATGSLIGLRMKMPNSAMRTLLGSGSAAAIAASFNTPLAGVVFAMEVILLEYTVVGFLPIILASVVATGVSIAVFGNEPIFSIPALSIDSLQEIPFVILLGLLVGLTSVILIRSLTFTAKKCRDWPFMARTTLAGTIVGLCAVVYPQVMGIGYDSVNAAMMGQMSLMALIGVMVFKSIATTAALGLGIPGGLIAPTLVIGSMLGAAVGYTSILSFPDIASNVGVYALLGMGAMMAATLQAPLAALVAIMELTYSPGIIFPCMLAIVIAELTRSELFGEPSAFRALLRARGLDYNTTPLTQHLSRVGVASVMERRCATTPEVIEWNKAETLLKDQPLWILIEKEGLPNIAMLAVDLARHMEDTEATETIDLEEIPAQRHSIEGIHLRASCLEADDIFRSKGLKLLYVFDTPAPNFKRVKAVLSKTAVDSVYR